MNARGKAKSTIKKKSSFEVRTMVKTQITRTKREHWSTISDLQSS